MRIRRPAQRLLGQTDLVLAQWRAVGTGRILLVRAAVSNVGVTGDQRGTLRLRLCSTDGRLDPIQVVRVHLLHVPAIGPETGHDVLGKGNVRRAFDRNLVVIVQVNELAQSQVACQTGRLVAQALHQIAIGDDGVRIVIKDRKARPVKGSGQKALGHRHPHPVGKALPQWAGGRLNASGQAILGMSRGTAAPLAKALEFLQWQVVTGQVKQAVEQHRAVPGREDKAVAVGPVRVGRIVTEEASPEYIGRVCHPHRHARVTGFRFLHAVHRQRANRVDA